MSDGELLTLDRAAGELGWRGRFRGERLRRVLTRAERAHGRRIMTRVGSRGDRKVSIGAIRRYCPELFDVGIDQVATALRKTFDEIDSKLDRRIVEHPKIQELARRTGVLEKGVLGLAKRVERLA